jgi:hypothetical protein
MTPKKKAIELTDRYAELASRFSQDTEWEYDKQCALICVDEIIKELDNCDCYNQIAHYKEVKKEIEKL